MTAEERRLLALARHRKQLDAGEVWTDTARQDLFNANNDALAALRRVTTYESFFRNFALRDWMRLEDPR